MKKILFILAIVLITKTINAQTQKHVEVVLSDTLLTSFDTVYWSVSIYVDYNSVNIDTNILKLKNPTLENKAKRAFAEDSTKKLLNLLNLSVKNMKDVYIAPDLIIDNYKEYYNSNVSFTYVTTSDAGIKNFIDYCDSKKIIVSISNVKYSNNENDEIILRKKLLEKSRKIALATMPSFNGKSIELLSISQTDPISKSNTYNSQNTATLKQLLNEGINFKLVNKLTLKFDYLIK